MTALDAAKFSALRGLVSHVLIVACQVTGVSPENMANFWADPGVRLCFELARRTGARVYASNETQYVDLEAILFAGRGDIDDYEGYILMVPPDGFCTWLPSNQAVTLLINNV